MFTVTVLTVSGLAMCQASDKLREQRLDREQTHWDMRRGTREALIHRLRVASHLRRQAAAPPQPDQPTEWDSDDLIFWDSDEYVNDPEAEKLFESTTREEQRLKKLEAELAARKVPVWNEVKNLTDPEIETKSFAQKIELAREFWRHYGNRKKYEDHFGKPNIWNLNPSQNGLSTASLKGDFVKGIFADDYESRAKSVTPDEKPVFDRMLLLLRTGFKEESCHHLGIPKTTTLWSVVKAAFKKKLRMVGNKVVNKTNVNVTKDSEGAQGAVLIENIKAARDLLKVNALNARILGNMAIKA